MRSQLDRLLQKEESDSQQSSGFATGPINTDTYIITNVRFLNVAVLPDDSDGSEMVSGVLDNDPGEKWRVTLLPNKKYTIKNCSYSSFANSGFRPVKGDTIAGKARKQQWVIRESKYQGQYIISPLDESFCWSLMDGETDSPIVFSDVVNNARNLWTFTSVAVD